MIPDPVFVFQVGMFYLPGLNNQSVQFRPLSQDLGGRFSDIVFVISRMLSAALLQSVILFLIDNKHTVRHFVVDYFSYDRSKVKKNNGTIRGRAGIY